MTANNEQGLIQVELVLAMPEKQEIVAMTIAKGSTVNEAINQSGILTTVDDFEFDPEKVGIFGSKVAIGQVLRDGDRVELYRALIADPKEVRRQRALQQAES